MKKGVGFAMGKVTSWVAYDNLDFGSAGSDTVTVQIWANTLDPVEISFLTAYLRRVASFLACFVITKSLSG